jgi:hypothetical protein
MTIDKLEGRKRSGEIGDITQRAHDAQRERLTEEERGSRLRTYVLRSTLYLAREVRREWEKDHRHT